MKRKFIATPLFLCLLQYVASAQYSAPQEKQISAEEKARRGDKLKGFAISENTGIPKRVNLMDTIAMSSHNYVAPERRSLGVSYKGNANSPWQSKIFFDRSSKRADFVYLDGYQKMMFTPDNVLFYNTKTPLTYAHYRKNFSDDVLEEVLNGTLSFNLGKSLNLGVSVDHASANGYYTNNKSSNIDYRIFGSYNSDKYDLWAYIANDYYTQQENGGIADLSYVTNPDKYSNGRVKLSSLDVPVSLNPPLFNTVRNGHGYLSHRYKLGYYRPSKTGDEKSSKADSLTFVPVGSFSHQVHYNTSERHMISNQASSQWNSFFGTAVSNIQVSNSGDNATTSVLPNDVAEFRSLKNTFSLSLLEGFKPWVKAGLSAYIRTENYWYSLPEDKSKSGLHTDKYFSTFVGGELSRSGGKGLNFNTKGELALLGQDLGTVYLSGDIQTKFRALGSNFDLKVDGTLQNYRPAYFAMHHHGTWGWWDDDFKFSRRLEFGAKAELNSFGKTWAEVRTASLQNQLYWTRIGRAMQYSNVIQMNMLRAGHQAHVGPLGWSLEGAYQISTANDIIPLPSLTARVDMYLDFMIAKVLQVQLGVEGYWHSAYKAPYYHAGVMQFVNQDYEKGTDIGGKAPLLNAYANFRMRTTRFYARFFNVGEAIMDNNRLSMDRYTYNPMHLEVGLVIDLKN